MRVAAVQSKAARARCNGTLSALRKKPAQPHRCTRLGARAAKSALRGIGRHGAHAAPRPSSARLYRSGVL